MRLTVRYRRSCQQLFNTKGEFTAIARVFCCYFLPRAHLHIVFCHHRLTLLLDVGHHSHPILHTSLPPLLLDSDPSCSGTSPFFSTKEVFPDSHHGHFITVSQKRDSPCFRDSPRT